MKKIVLLAAVAGTATVAMAQNQGHLLTDGDAVFRFGTAATTATGNAFPTNNTSTGRVSIDFRLTGGPATTGVDSGFDHNWYVGLGTGRTREFGMGGVMANFARVTTTNSVTYSITNAFGVAGLNAVASYTLWDSGAGMAQVINSLTLTNTTGADLANLDIFYSVDHDIGGTAAGDTFDPLSIVGNDRVLIQRDNAAAGGPWAMALIGFGANASGAGGFSALNTQLTDGSPDFVALADLGSAGNATPGDYAQFVQWRVNLAAGASASFRADILGANNGGVVPAPASAALLGIATLAASRRRRA
ncbi:MAG TPA: hypothetical protein VEB22_05500 [Phycisphaerales bacterium]|nr:hypothetical protein [Phycisphaerales bacterium]